LKTLEGDSLDTVAAEADITIKQLFTMTSGLSYGFFPGQDKLDTLYEEKMKTPPKGKKNPNTEEFIDSLAQLPLAFQPGSDYRYSFSIDVLGRLIEVISGKTLGDFLESEIFIPLGMNDTGFHVNEDQGTRLAGLYQYDGEKRVLIEGFFNPLKKPAFESGGGGLLSTMSDYSNFCEMLLNKGSFEGADVLGRKTVELMAANHLEGKAFDRFYKGDQWGGKAGYGYGLGVRTLLNPAKAGINGSIGEFGWDGAASTWMMVDPKEELTVLYMVQMFPYGYHDLRQKFLQMVYSALR
jgi:CubicO group peptidase (beta-lactamase class C family)